MSLVVLNRHAWAQWIRCVSSLIASVFVKETEPKWAHVSPQFTSQITYNWLLRSRGGNMTRLSLGLALGLVSRPLMHSASSCTMGDTRLCLLVLNQVPVLLTSYIMSRHWAEPILHFCAHHLRHGGARSVYKLCGCRTPCYGAYLHVYKVLLPLQRKKKKKQSFDGKPPTTTQISGF